MKKLLTLCAAVLMAFAVTGSAMAADAVTVYVEPGKCHLHTVHQPRHPGASFVPGSHWKACHHVWRRTDR